MNLAAALINTFLTDSNTDIAAAAQVFDWYKHTSGMRSALLRAPLDSPLVALAMTSGLDRHRAVLAQREDLGEAAFLTLSRLGPASTRYALAGNPSVPDEVLIDVLSYRLKLAPMKVLERDEVSARVFCAALAAADELADTLSDDQLSEVSTLMHCAPCAPLETWPEHPALLLALADPLCAHCPPERTEALVARLLDAERQLRINGKRGRWLAQSGALEVSDAALVAAGKLVTSEDDVATPVREALARRKAAAALWASSGELSPPQLVAALEERDLLDVALVRELAASAPSILVPGLVHMLNRSRGLHSHPVVSPHQVEAASDGELVVVSTWLGERIGLTGRRLVDAISAGGIVVDELVDQLRGTSVNLPGHRLRSMWEKVAVARALESGALDADAVASLPVALLGRLPRDILVDLAARAQEMFAAESSWMVFNSLLDSKKLSLDSALSVAAAVLTERAPTQPT